MAFNVFKYILKIIFIFSILFLIILYICIIIFLNKYHKINENNLKILFENTLFYVLRTENI